MTIASAFNEITQNLGGTPSTSGTIAGAIDALNDTLAGSDQQAAQTIEGAIRLLGENIGGGGGGGGTANVAIVNNTTSFFNAIGAFVYADEYGEFSVSSVEVSSSSTTQAKAFMASDGALVILDTNAGTFTLSGNVEQGEDRNAFIVKGDCSITVAS